jgi:hypothetical protein
MKLARNTKERIAHIKNEASSPKSRLMQLLNQLEEMPGTKAICSKLEDVIGRLEHWQNARL